MERKFGITTKGGIHLEMIEDISVIINDPHTHRSLPNGTLSYDPIYVSNGAIFLVDKQEVMYWKYDIKTEQLEVIGRHEQLPREI